MVYLYENTYSVIPEQSTHAVDLDHVQITSEPTHLDLLSVNDCGWSVRYLDTHSSLDDARAYLVRCYGDIRDADKQGNPFTVQHALAGCLAVIKPGRCHPLPLDQSIHFVYSHISGLVTPKSTKAQIARLSNQVRKQANDADLILSGDIEAQILRMKNSLSRVNSSEVQLELIL